MVGVLARTTRDKINQTKLYVRFGFETSSNIGWMGLTLSEFAFVSFADARTETHNVVCSESMTELSGRSSTALELAWRPRLQG